MERLQEIATRKAELKALLESEEKQDLEAIEKELNELDMEEKSINEQVEAETRKAEQEAEERKAEAEALNNNEIPAMEVKEIELKKEDIKMTELRNTPEYIDAYAEYIKTNDDTKLRSLTTENVSGRVAVPEFVYDIVKTAWDKEEVMALVRKAELKGNLKVNFEISGDGAVKHLEGSEAVTEENLVLGIVTLVPSSFKKWVGISDEVYDMRGEAFLRYIYEEITHRIAKKCADELVGIIAALPGTATATSPKADAITKGVAQDTIISAIGHLCDEASNPVVIINKLTYSAFKNAEYEGNWKNDAFEGLKVVFNSTLPAYDSADANAVYCIVGDLGNGALANFPNGIGNMEFKFDDKTLMTSDMIRILGREYVGMGVVACDHFCLVKKPSASI